LIFHGGEHFKKQGKKQKEQNTSDQYVGMHSVYICPAVRGLPIPKLDQRRRG
jgi:hypothetical protein